jgi:hypothetical protein
MKNRNLRAVFVLVATYAALLVALSAWTTYGRPFFREADGGVMEWDAGTP